MLQNLQQRVAIQRFSSGNFVEAMELFETCNIDSREVCTLEVYLIYQQLIYFSHLF